jgi:hypothetical protein
MHAVRDCRPLLDRHMYNSLSRQIAGRGEVSPENSILLLYFIIPSPLKHSYAY